MTGTLREQVHASSLPHHALSPTPIALQSSDWPTYHHDNARTGYLPDEPDPGQLKPAWTAKLDNAVYAEPLAIGQHVIVATIGDSLYSLDARTGKVQWRTNVGRPVPLSSILCRGTVDPLGIIGTPVYDPGSGLVFAVAEVTGPVHLLVPEIASVDPRMLALSLVSAFLLLRLRWSVHAVIGAAAALSLLLTWAA